MLLGGALPWMFSSLAINAVNRAAGLIVDEVRRQFRDGVLEPVDSPRHKAPDYRQAVSISTAAAQKELGSLSVLSVVPPFWSACSWASRRSADSCRHTSRALLAVYMCNAGGAWDNAKELIEDEPRDPKQNMGKHSERHKAAVVGDTVGDPLKDTAGPALNPMIKVVNLVSVIVAPVVVIYKEINLVTVVIGLVLLAALVWAVWRSKSEATSSTSAIPLALSGQRCWLHRPGHKPGRWSQCFSVGRNGAQLVPRFPKSARFLTISVRPVFRHDLSVACLP